MRAAEHMRGAFAARRPACHHVPRGTWESSDFAELYRFAAATLKPRASVDHEGKAKTCVLTLTQNRKKYETERYRAEKVGTQYSKKERAERFKEPSDRTVVEAASYEATKGAVEQAALLQDRKWSTLNGLTLAQAVSRKKEEH